MFYGSNWRMNEKKFKSSDLLVWVVKVVQKDPKDTGSEFESIVFWIFLQDQKNLVRTKPNDSKDCVKQVLPPMNG